MNWDLLEQIRKSRVTIDVDATLNTPTEVGIDLDAMLDTKLKLKLSDFEHSIREVRKHGDPDYKSYHIRIPTYNNESAYYLATKLKLELCRKGLLDLDQFAFDLTMGTFSTLFNEKIEVTKDTISYHYESDVKEQLLKPLLNTCFSIIGSDPSVIDIKYPCTYDTKFLKVYCADNGHLYVYPTELWDIVEVQIRK